MKSTSTITILLAAGAASFVAPVQGREAMLGDEDKGQRRLFFRDIDYGDIFERCCVPADADDEWPDCKCPKRTSDQKSLLDKWLYGADAKTYEEKWAEQCADGGW
eukprot:CAMPEP_0201697142 /NCGR_PEP_ID=MMETSP0578-20130828/9620_1 /ASSEMBLY_ACC=CAM_ASM_000663 /TAXON_ID=267565 /ORGANISM="Skeletonema grethea, Strain CCMP 1804" /LENGTH=104 /DNA_ID=CAMNT_0048183225 /DNA_START=61 /DNA_END=372 /DNA_ORIENTATION=+